MTDRIPAHELAAAPELAVLAVLRSAAEATQAVIEALFPGNEPLKKIGGLTPLDQRADALCRLVPQVLDAVSAYRSALRGAAPLPFRWPLVDDG